MLHCSVSVSLLFCFSSGKRVSNVELCAQRIFLIRVVFHSLCETTSSAQEQCAQPLTRSEAKCFRLKIETHLFPFFTHENKTDTSKH